MVLDPLGFVLVIACSGWGWVMESGSRRLDALNGVAVSEQTDPQSIIEKRIAEAREENDFVTASRLQQQWEKRYGRGE